MTESASFQFPRIGELLDHLGIRLSKHKSQHFLKQHQICTQIACMGGVDKSVRAIEIGAGLGNLSVELAKAAGSVVSVEMDESFRSWHSTLHEAFPNLAFHYGDFMKVDLESVLPTEPDGPIVAVGNLPYQITAPILFKLINSPISWQAIVVMVQLEVAERLAAGPRSRRASALTYKVALEYDVEITMRLNPREFLPPPKVHSAVAVLTPKAQPFVKDAEHKERLHRLLTGVFQHRRRMLPNGLMLSGLIQGREQAESVVERAGIDLKARPEALGLEDFVRLDEAMESCG